MKVAIVFHSVCGNVFLMAKAFEESFQAAGHQAKVFRVSDTDWVQKPDISPKAVDILRSMMTLPEAKSDDLLDADLILLGSPTYFGNVTAEMKAFMDSTGGLWFQAKLAGKKCAAFASAGNAEGGGDLCLQAIHIYAKYMGMACLPVPVTLVPSESWPALGLIQYSNGKYAEVLDPKVSRAIKSYASFLAKTA